MSRFAIEKTPIDGLHVYHRQPIGDERGYLERMFCSEELQSIIGSRKIIQINHTKTAKAGIVRGMHFQYPPYAEMKFVSCLRGEVFDVAVDLRQESPTFLKWHAETLSQNNHKTFMIPEGFAHGFQALSDDCEMIYFHTATYIQEAEAGLNALDARLAIDWPLTAIERSLRDQQHLMLTDDFVGIRL